MGVLGVRLELTLAFLLREWLLPIERPELVARVFLWKAWAVPGFASPCWRGEWSRSLRTASVRYSYSVVCSPLRGRASGYLLVIATRASDSKWSG